MKNKWIWVIAGVFTLLNLLLLWQSTDNKKPEPKLFPHLSKEDIHGIILEMGSERVHLEKLHGTWLLKKHQFPANKTYMEMLLEGILDTPLGTKSTDNVDIHKKFELEGRAWEIKILDKDQSVLERFYVGKYDPSYRGTYIRLHQDPTIRYVPIAYHVFMRRPTWADRTLWQFPESQLEQISWQRDKKTTTWFRMEHSFESQEGNQLAPEFVTSLTNPQAQTVVFDLNSGQIQKFGTLTLLAGGAQISLNIYQSGEQWYGKRDQNQGFYLLAEDLLKPFISRQ